MKKTKIAICWVAIAISMIILVVGVDHYPLMACWMPLIISFVFALRCEAFREHITHNLDKICPIE